MPIDDRDYNFTVPENQASGLRIPEHAIRQLISYGFAQVRKHVDDPKNNLIDELFARLSDDVRKQIKSWFREHPNITTEVNWPREDIAFPFISVVNEGSTSDAEASMLGDYGGMHVIGSGAVQVAREVRRIADRNTTSLYIATEDPNLTLFLSAIARYIVLSNRDDLTKWYDIHDLTLSMQDVRWDERFVPRFGYIRVVQLSYLSYYDFYVGESTSKIVSLGLAVALRDAAGEEVVSDVPSVDP